MREIKFRAFSKKSKGMVLVEYATFLKDDSLVIYDDYELMQYTGLKDKNGVEIYEGDIVGGTLSDGTNGKSEVFWGYNCYQPFSYLGCRSEDLEVIGNIFENSELLND